METFLSSRLRFCDKSLNDTFVFLSFVEQMDSKTVTPEDTVEPGVRVVLELCFIFGSGCFCFFFFFLNYMSVYVCGSLEQERFELLTFAPSL